MMPDVTQKDSDVILNIIMILTRNINFISEAGKCKSQTNILTKRIFVCLSFILFEVSLVQE